MSRSVQVVSRGVFIAAALLCLLVLCFIALHHQRLLTSAMRMVFFAGLPLFGFVLSLAALRLPADLRLTAALTLVGAATGVYGAEAYLTFRSQPVSAALPAHYDQRNKAQVVRDLRANGDKAYPAVFPNYLLQSGIDGMLHAPLTLDGREVLPLSGIPLVTSVLCNESGSYVIYRADEMGFNNAAGGWNRPLAVALVGDSFTQGYCVDRADSFAGRLAEGRADVLNLGMSGAGPLVELAMVREYLPQRRPPLVLWFFYEGNDIPGDIEIEKRSPLLRLYLQAGFSQGLEAERDRVGQALADFVDTMMATPSTDGGTDAGAVQNVISFVGLAKVRQILRLPSTQSDQVDYPLFEAALTQARDTVQGWGGCLAVVHLSAHPSTDRSDLPAIRQALRAIIDRVGLPLIDAHAALRAQPNQDALYPLGISNHYGPLGHRVVADTVRRAMENGLSGCPQLTFKF